MENKGNKKINVVVMGCGGNIMSLRDVILAAQSFGEPGTMIKPAMIKPTNERNEKETEIKMLKNWQIANIVEDDQTINDLTKREFLRYCGLKQSQGKTVIVGGVKYEKYKEDSVCGQCLAKNGLLDIDCINCKVNVNRKDKTNHSIAYRMDSYIDDLNDVLDDMLPINLDGKPHLYDGKSLDEENEHYGVIVFDIFSSSFYLMEKEQFNALSSEDHIKNNVKNDICNFAIYRNAFCAIYLTTIGEIIEKSQIDQSFNLIRNEISEIETLDKSLNVFVVYDITHKKTKIVYPKEFCQSVSPVLFTDEMVTKIAEIELQLENKEKVIKNKEKEKQISKDQTFDNKFACYMMSVGKKVTKSSFANTEGLDADTYIFEVCNVANDDETMYVMKSASNKHPEKIWIPTEKEMEDKDYKLFE